MGSFLSRARGIEASARMRGRWAVEGNKKEEKSGTWAVLQWSCKSLVGCGVHVQKLRGPRAMAKTGRREWEKQKEKKLRKSCVTQTEGSMQEPYKPSYFFSPNQEEKNRLANHWMREQFPDKRITLCRLLALLSPSSLHLAPLAPLPLCQEALPRVLSQGRRRRGSMW